MRDNDVVILAARRSPIGKRGRALRDWSAPQLAGPVIEAALKDVSSHMSAESVGRVIMGNVLSAGLGQNPAKQAAVAGGLPFRCPAHTTGRVCSSSLMALWDAYRFVREERELVIAGGMESMSNAPEDMMLHDGLCDAFCEGNPHMGELADRTASNLCIERSSLDEYAFESYRRAYEAKKLGAASMGIVPSCYPISYDEGIREPNLEGIKNLPAVFGERITAGNISQLSDGAAALLVAPHGLCKKRSAYEPLARLIAFADYAGESRDYSTAPVMAAQNVLKKAGIGLSKIDLFEVNEASAVVPLHFMRRLTVPHEKMNIWGGAVAMGHPLGASGARIVVTLIRALYYTGGRYGLAVVCNGGGEAVAVIIENLQR